MQLNRIIITLCVLSLVLVSSVNGEESSSEEDKDLSPPKSDPSKSESDDLEGPASVSPSKPDANRGKANYTEPRFAQLFNTRNRPRDHKVRIPVKYTTRAKPTLPPFIRNPPHLRVTTDEPSTTRSPRTTRSPTVKSPVRTTTSASSPSSSSSSRSRSRSSANQVPSTYEVTTRKPSRKFGDSSPFTPRNSTRTRVRPGN